MFLSLWYSLYVIPPWTLMKLVEKILTKPNFLRALRLQFVKGAQNVFLFRLFQFMKLKRGRLDISRFVAKYSLMRKRMLDAWMDLPDHSIADDRSQFGGTRQHATTGVSCERPRLAGY